MPSAEPLAFRLAEIAGLAQATFQKQYQHIDPIIGVNRQMRKQGFAVDLLTIDCAKSKNRVTVLIQDAKPDSVEYQFSKTDLDPKAHFDSITVQALNEKVFLEWMIKGLIEQA